MFGDMGNIWKRALMPRIVCAAAYATLLNGASIDSYKPGRMALQWSSATARELLTVLWKLRFCRHGYGHVNDKWLDD